MTLKHLKTAFWDKHKFKRFTSKTVAVADKFFRPKHWSMSNIIQTTQLTMYSRDSWRLRAILLSSLVCSGITAPGLTPIGNSLLQRIAFLFFSSFLVPSLMGNPKARRLSTLRIFVSTSWYLPERFIMTQMQIILEMKRYSTVYIS